MALVLGLYLPVARRCPHITGHGGAKYAVRDVRDHLPDTRFVLRTDVKSYYASIDHLMLLDQLAWMTSSFWRQPAGTCAAR